MKKILTKEEKERKGTRNKIIIGLIMVGIMLLSTAGYAFYSSTEEEIEKIEYGGIEFVSENSVWVFKIQKMTFLAQFNPIETENISVPIFISLGTYYKSPLFFIGKGEARQEIERNIYNLVSRVQPEDVCLGDEEICNELPVKNCEKDNIIIIEEAERISITQKDNCVFISAPYSEQVRAADAFLFKIMGIRDI